ncbi:Major Facilitator Superfamily (MFS) [Trachipleistophora hominis]|uniref:Lysosomal dipeptide transporter MFSD1 n=1 Tax=Trachipleistophora hominis TaxID=72359 RepID=L7JQZ4_TRAHO|nr:Major Facilitator Superfamily (MFS) [Trachipleistophora hominis]
MNDRYRQLFYSSIILFSSYFSYDIPAALNKNIHLGSTKFSSYEITMLYSAYALPNIFVPLIFTFVTEYSESTLNVFLSFLVLAGQCVFTLGIFKGVFYVSVFGRLLFGIGNETLFVIQSKLITTTFKGRELAFALAVFTSLGRLGIVFNFLITPYLAKRYSASVPSLIGLVLILVGLVLNLLAKRRPLQIYQAELSTSEPVRVHNTDKTVVVVPDVEHAPQVRVPEFVLGGCFFSDEANVWGGECLMKSKPMKLPYRTEPPTFIRTRETSTAECEVRDELKKGIRFMNDDDCENLWSGGNDTLNEDDVACNNNINKLSVDCVKESYRASIYEKCYDNNDRSSNIDGNNSNNHNSNNTNISNINNINNTNNTNNTNINNINNNNVNQTSISQSNNTRSNDRSAGHISDSCAFFNRKNCAQQTIKTASIAHQNAKESTSITPHKISFDEINRTTHIPIIPCTPEKHTISPYFSILVLIAFLSAFVWAPFYNLGPLLFQKRYNYTREASASMMGVLEMVQMVTIIAIGVLSDFTGIKLLFVALGALLLAISHVCIYLNCNVVAVICTLGIAGPLHSCYWPCVSNLAAQERLSFAFAVISSFLNLSFTVSPLVASYLLQIDGSFRLIEGLSVVFAVFTFVIVLVLNFIDLKKKLGMNKRQKC